MNDSNLDQQLSEFLQWEKGQRQRGITLEALHSKVDALTRAQERIAADRLRDRQTLLRYGRRLASLEHQVALVSQRPEIPDWHPDPSEITGTHQFVQLQKAHEDLEERLDEEDSRKRDSVMWWKRQRWVWFFAALGFVVATAISTGCSVAVARLMPAPTPIK